MINLRLLKIPHGLPSALPELALAPHPHPHARTFPLLAASALRTDADIHLVRSLVIIVHLGKHRNELSSSEMTFREHYQHTNQER